MSSHFDTMKQKIEAMRRTDGQPLAGEPIRQSDRIGMVRAAISLLGLSKDTSIGAERTKDDHTLAV